MPSEAAVDSKSSTSAASRTGFSLRKMVASVAAEQLALVREPELSAESLDTISEAAPAVAEIQAAGGPPLKTARAETEEGSDAEKAAAEPALATESDIKEALTEQAKRLLKWQLRAQPDISKDIAEARLCEEAFVGLVCVLALLRGTLAATPAEAMPDTVIQKLADAVAQAASVDAKASPRPLWPRWVRHMCAVAYGATDAATPPAVVRPATLQQNSTNASSTPAAKAAATPSKDRTAVDYTPESIAAMHSVKTTGITPEEALRICRHAKGTLDDSAHLALQLMLLRNPGVEYWPPCILTLQDVFGIRRDSFPASLGLSNFHSRANTQVVSRLHRNVPDSWDIGRRIVLTLELANGATVCVVTDLKGRPMFLSSVDGPDAPVNAKAAITRMLNHASVSDAHAIFGGMEFLFAPEELAGTHTKLICPVPVPREGALTGDEQRQRALVQQIVEPALATQKWLQQFRGVIKGRTRTPVADSVIRDRLQWLCWVRAQLVNLQGS